jgi:folylpolyglutamate synthase/dihydropteroate synthase
MERALTAESNAAAARESLWRNEVIKPFENPMDAIAEASKDNDVVLACGSLYFIGWIRPRLKR